jgi:predicted N-acetyltransferase YhbS
MPVSVRVARPDDYETVGRLTVAAYQTLEVDHLWGGYDDDILDTATRAEHADVLVAEVDGRVVGAVTFVADNASGWSEWTHPGEAQFRLLAVEEASRASGTGRALVEACMERARRAGQPIVIHTTPWMQSAQRLYGRLGFVRSPDRDVPYEHWRTEQSDELVLPPEWVGQPFLAFRWTPEASQSG